MSDYITKNQAIKAVEGAVSAEHVCDNINAIPAADVEPVVRGEWIETDFGRFGKRLVCSICGKKEIIAYDRCRCGAHMERSGSCE